MKPVAIAVVADLRERKLLPVAALLLALLVIVPVVMLKSSSAAAPVPAAPAAATSTGGLPSPEAALSAADKPLVTLATLNSSSDLDSFEPKNPFKPLRKLEDTQTASSGSSGSVPGTDTGTGTSGGGSGSAPSAGGGGGGTTGGGAPTGGGSPSPTTPDTGNGSPQTQQPDQSEPKRSLTYAVDLTIEGPKGTRRYHGVPKLSLLPSQDNPLLVFLGVEDGGTKAVFLVDATLRTLSGEGTCSPSPDQCATLKIEPGQRHTLVNDRGTRWTIEIDEVRETSVAKAAAAARAADKRRKAHAAVGEPRRFAPPLITDLFTGGQS